MAYSLMPASRNFGIASRSSTSCVKQGGHHTAERKKTTAAFGSPVGVEVHAAAGVIREPEVGQTLADLGTRGRALGWRGPGAPAGPVRRSPGRRSRASSPLPYRRGVQHATAKPFTQQGEVGVHHGLRSHAFVVLHHL